MSKPTIPVLFAALSSSFLTGCENSPWQGRALSAQVEIVDPVEFVATPSPSSLLGLKFAALAEIDPEHPLADPMSGQTLSLFGREDLIASARDDYRASGCAQATLASDVYTEIERRARKTSVVIISESHERSEHRGFTAEVVKRLRPLGYNTLAIETLANPTPDTPQQYLPPFLKRPSQPYLEDADGYYLSEAAFGRLGRLAKAMQYRLVPYEAHSEPTDRAKPQDEQIAVREERQASNLAAFLRDNPDAKVIVHVGYSHAAEVPRSDGARWMAAHLKDKTGIDPLTISQTTCRGGASSIRFAALPANEPPGSFDLVIDHPEARFEGARPFWRKQAGDQLVAIASGLTPLTGWRVIEARPVGEPATSVPIDRVAIRRGENVKLLLPPGRYNLRIIDVSIASTPSHSSADKDGG